MNLLDKLKYRLSRKRFFSDGANTKEEDLRLLLFSGNYKPVAYFFTEVFYTFTERAAKSFQEVYKTTNADDLNSGLLLMMIEAQEEEMLCSARQQHVAHHTAIDQIVAKAAGQIELARQLIERCGAEIEQMKLDLPAPEEDGSDRKITIKK